MTDAPRSKLRPIRHRVTRISVDKTWPFCANPPTSRDGAFDDGVSHKYTGRCRDCRTPVLRHAIRCGSCAYARKLKLGRKRKKQKGGAATCFCRGVEWVRMEDMP